MTFRAECCAPRPTPYAATYFLVRIDDRKAGREMLRRVNTAITSAVNPVSPEADAWVSFPLTFQGSRHWACRRSRSIAFAPEFQHGMAARAQELGDVGENNPVNWEKRLARLTSMLCWPGSRPMRLS